MLKVFRVRRKFQFRGWVYAPTGRCMCPPECGRFDDIPGTDRQEFTPCSGQTATGCQCSDQKYCRAPGLGACGIKPWQYGGDKFIIQEGDPYIEGFIRQRYIVSDSAMPSYDEMVAEYSSYSKLIDTEPFEGQILFANKELVPA